MIARRDVQNPHLVNTITRPLMGLAASVPATAGVRTGSNASRRDPRTRLTFQPDQMRLEQPVRRWHEQAASGSAAAGRADPRFRAASRRSNSATGPGETAGRTAVVVRPWDEDSIGKARLP